MNFAERIKAAFPLRKRKTADCKRPQERRCPFPFTENSTAEEITFWIELYNNDPVLARGFTI